MADIPGDRYVDGQEGTDFAEDRAYLENAIRKQSATASDIADLLASSYERQFFEMFLRNKRINKEYVNLRCGDMDSIQNVLSQQLDQFLARKSEVANHSAIAVLPKKIAQYD